MEEENKELAIQKLALPAKRTANYSTVMNIQILRMDTAGATHVLPTHKLMRVTHTGSTMGLGREKEFSTQTIARMVDLVLPASGQM